MLAHDLFDLSEPRFRCTGLRPCLPVAPLWDRLKRALERCDPASNSRREVLGDVAFSDELCENLFRLLEVLRRFVPERPILPKEIRGGICVHDFPITIRSLPHLLAE